MAANVVAIMLACNQGQFWVFGLDGAVHVADLYKTVRGAAVAPAATTKKPGGENQGEQTKSRRASRQRPE